MWLILAAHQDYIDNNDFKLRALFKVPLDHVRPPLHLVGAQETFDSFLFSEFEYSQEARDDKPVLLYYDEKIVVTNLFELSSNIEALGQKIYVSIKVSLEYKRG